MTGGAWRLGPAPPAFAALPLPLPPAAASADGAVSVTCKKQGAFPPSSALSPFLSPLAPAHAPAPLALRFALSAGPVFACRGRL